MMLAPLIKYGMAIVLIAAPWAFALTANPEDTPNGWATGTIGGNGGSEVTVTTPSDFNTQAQKPGKAVIWVSGTLQGDCTVGTGDKTILGAPGATVEGTLTISGVSNVIVRNIFVHITTPCIGTSGAGTCEEGPDGVHVSGSTSVWLDHLSVLDANDGNMDITKASDLITITWCKFHYTRTGSNHQFSNLIGGADSVPADSGKLNCTFHHCWWADGVRERMPRVRYGKVHVYNNLFTSAVASYCIRVGYLADIFAEANAFIGVKNPVNYYDANGVITMKGNYYKNTTGDTISRGTSFTPVYPYSVEDPSTIQNEIQAMAGNTITAWSTSAVSFRKHPGLSSGPALARIERRAGVPCIINDAGSLAIVKVTDLSGRQISRDITLEAGKTAFLSASRGIILVKVTSAGRTQTTIVNQVR